MSDETTAAETAPDASAPGDKFNAMANEAIAALRTARDDCRTAELDCETLLSAIDHTLAADAVRTGVFHSIRAAVEFARDRTTDEWQYCPDTPCEKLLSEASACIRAVEDVHFAALQKIFEATAEIVGPRDEVAQCNDPVDALKEMRDRLAKVVAAFKPNDKAGFPQPFDDLPF